MGSVWSAMRQSALSARSSVTGCCIAWDFILALEFIGLVVNATIGAIVLLLALRLLRASEWGGHWR
jgi:hypothetical protein